LGIAEFFVADAFATDGRTELPSAVAGLRAVDFGGVEREGDADLSVEDETDGNENGQEGRAEFSHH
jgi:hypothetical protein